MPAYSQLVTYFFSGTGNARRLSLWITQTAQRLGAVACAQPIEAVDAAPPSPSPGSLVGLAFPVHGFTTIWVMLKFVPFSPRYPAALAAVFTIWSGIDYFREGLRQLHPSVTTRPGSHL